jgi:hypothetical protein
MLQLWFGTKKKVDFLAKISPNDAELEGAENMCLHWLTKNHIIVQCRLTKAGEYSLELFAKERGSDGNLPHVCSYLIRAHEDTVDQSAFPAPRAGRLGGTSANQATSLVPLSHQCPYVELEESAEMELEFSAPKRLVLMTELWINDGQTSRQFEDYVLPREHNDKLTLQVRFPQIGYYRLSIYAKLADSDGPVRNVYNYMISVNTPDPNCVPFPKSYAEWGRGCQLIEPQNGVLSENQNVNMNLDIPNAYHVAVGGPGHWTILKRVSLFNRIQVGDCKARRLMSILSQTCQNGLQLVCRGGYEVIISNVSPVTVAVSP